MSAEQTNLPKQKRRHWAPLVGLWSVLAFAAVAALTVFSMNLSEEVETGNLPAPVAGGEG